MGQPITVTVRAGAAPDVRFFECNRSLTGMAIEVYTAAEAPSGDRPPDVLAQRLLDAGAVKVTIYSNVVTVEAPADVVGRARAQGDLHDRAPLRVLRRRRRLVVRSPWRRAGDLQGPVARQRLLAAVAGANICSLSSERGRRPGSSSQPVVQPVAAVVQPAPADEHARAQLRAAATRAAPAVLAGERLLAVAGPIGRLLPAGGIRRGSTVALDGPPGAGSTTVALPPRRGNHLRRRVGGGRRPRRHVGGAGRGRGRVSPWNGARSSGASRPIAGRRSSAPCSTGSRSSRPWFHRALRPGDARRLTARARERATVLVALGPWPVEASLRLHARGRNWSGLATGGGLLADRELDVRVEGKGARGRSGCGAAAEPTGWEAQRERPVVSDVAPGVSGVPTGR